jgi:hypothetical protein
MAYRHRSWNKVEMTFQRPKMSRHSASAIQFQSCAFNCASFAVTNERIPPIYLAAPFLDFRCEGA